MDAKCFLALALLAIAAPCSAQSVDDLAQVQAETIMYLAQAARNDAMAKARGDGAAALANADDTLPVVRGVFGSGRTLFATFLYGNGSVVDAPLHGRIPGGYIVAKLSPTGVELSRNGKRYTLGFSDQRPMTVQAPPPVAMPSPPGDPFGAPAHY